MHVLNVVTLFLVLVLAGVEFSVSAFVNPSAWRLDPEPQSRMLSHFAALLGKVMPFWYAGNLVLLGTETWLQRHTAGFWVLAAASAVWAVAVVASLIFLVPLNNRVAEGVAGWQEIHRSWDKRHRVRVAALAIAAVLLLEVLVR